MPDEIEAIYASLPKIDCKGLCHNACGAITMSSEEWRRLRKAFGPLKLVRPGRCPVLRDDNLCSAYKVRPLICRLYGVVEGMKCPYGCKPAKYLTDEEAYRLLDRMKRIGGKTRDDLIQMNISIQRNPLAPGGR